MTRNGRICFSHRQMSPWSDHVTLIRVVTIMMTIIIAAIGIVTEGASLNSVALLRNMFREGRVPKTGWGSALVLLLSPGGCFPITLRQLDSAVPGSSTHPCDTHGLSMYYEPGAGCRVTAHSPCPCRVDCLVGEGSLLKPSPHQRKIMTLTSARRGRY